MRNKMKKYWFTAEELLQLINAVDGFELYTERRIHNNELQFKSVDGIWVCEHKLKGIES